MKNIWTRFLSSLSGKVVHHSCFTLAINCLLLEKSLTRWEPNMHHIASGMIAFQNSPALQTVVCSLKAPGGVSVTKGQIHTTHTQELSLFNAYYMWSGKFELICVVKCYLVFSVWIFMWSSIKIQQKLFSYCLLLDRRFFLNLSLAHM